MVFMLVFYEAVFISKLTCQLSSFFVQNFVQTTSTLCKTTTTHCKTTSTLDKERRQLCTNNVHTLYEHHQLCQNNVNTCPNSAQSTLSQGARFLKILKRFRTEKSQTLVLPYWPRHYIPYSRSSVFLQIAAVPIVIIIYTAISFSVQLFLWVSIFSFKRIIWCTLKCENV